MKKNNLYAACFMAVVALTACNDEMHEIVQSGDNLIVEASMGIESRTSLNDDAQTVVWSEGDQIYLFGGNSNATMTLKSGENTTKGTFSGTVNGMASDLINANALYPIPNVKGDKYTFELPATREYSENSAAPMIGSLSGTHVSFQNLTALVRIPVWSNDKERVLKLSMEGITGTLAVDVDKKTAEMEGNPNNEVTVTIPAGPACYIDIPVPANTYTGGLTITLDNETIVENTSSIDLNDPNATLFVLIDPSNNHNSGTEADYYIETVADLLWVANQVNNVGNNFNGKKLVMTEDIDLSGINWTPIGACDGPAYFQGTFDGQGHIISNLYVDNSSDTDMNSTTGLFGWIDAAGATIKNIKMVGATVKGSHWTGVIAGYATGTISGCDVSYSTVVGVHVNDDADGDKIAGIVGYLNEHSYLNNNKVSYTTITGNRDIGGIAGAVAASTYEMNNNVVEDVTLTYSTLKSYASAGVFVSARNPYDVNETNTSNNVTIKYAGEVTNNNVLAKVIEAGTTEIELPEGSFVVPDEAKGKTLSFIGTGKPEDTKIATQDDGSYEGCDYSLDGSTVTFENISINTNSATYTGYARLNATYKNCIINGTYTLYGNSVFEDCTFNVSGDVYNIWTWGAPTAEFNRCTFNSDGKALLLYGTENTKLTINECTFNDKGGLTDLKAAIEIGNDYGKSYELIVNKTIVNGYEINDKGINTGTRLWANKNSMSTENLNVIVDGVDVY